MNRYIISLFICFIYTGVLSQNKIGIRGGFTTTNTSVSEYNRDVGYFYYDSVTLDSRVVFPSVNLDVDIDLGKNWFLTNGLSYMRKGIESINYDNGGYWLEARQEYIGMNVMLKYHHKFQDEKFGIYAAAGFRSDFTVGGPNIAEIAYGIGKEYFHAFGTFSVAEFALPTTIGASYQLGPGEVILEANFIKGLSDVLPDRYIVGRTFSVGASLGYYIYLQ